MGDPILDSVLGGSSKKRRGSGDPLLDRAISPQRGSGDPLLDSILSPRKQREGDTLQRQFGRAQTPEDRLAALEALAAAEGYEKPPSALKSLAMTAADLLSRGNYAVAGAAEELLTERGGGLGAAAKRAGREIFSGIGDIKGDKEGFAQVMEQSGVGTGGSLSDIAPFLYSETGEGPALKRGGVLDPTARGAGGLALDIVADPINLVSLGTAKGLTVAGKTIPLTDKVTLGLARGAGRAIKASPILDKGFDTIGKVFNRDWYLRKTPEALRLKQAHLNREAFARSSLYDDIGRSTIAAIPKKRWAEFVDAVDDGTAATKYANDPKMLEAAEQWKAFNDNFAQAEVSAGLLNEDRVLSDYLAHFYENSPEELDNFVGLWPGKFRGTDLGRHAEERAFSTLREAEEWSKAQHALDPRVPVLRPVRNPLEILRRRGEASLKALEWKQYAGELAATVGKKDARFIIDDIFDLSKEQTGVKETMRRELLNAESTEQVNNILARYGVENAPKQKRLVKTLAEDGTPYVRVDLKGLEGVEIPKSVADDLADMSNRAIRSKELNHMLRYYDRMNNVFKSFVTVPFPAFHFRNAYSNLALGFADIGASVLNPGRHFDGIAAMRGAEGGFRSKIGEEILYKAEQAAMKKNGVMQSGRALLEYTGQQGIDRLATIGGKVKAAPRRLGQTIENEARASLYMIYRRRGLSQVDAAERVNKILFDYTNLSHVEQEVFRRMIPFYTFARKNLERQFRNVFSKPGLTAAEIKAFRGRFDENEEMTSWEGNSFKLRLNKDGRTLTTLSGIDLPFRQLDLLWRGSVPETLRGQIGMLSPVLQAPLVGAFGKIPFTGREIERSPESPLVGRVIEHFPKGVQNYLGYRKDFDKAGRPKYTFEGDKFYAFFQSLMLSRIISTTDRQFKTLADDPRMGPVLLDMATGLRYKQINLDEEKQKKMAERLRYLEKWGREKGFLLEHERTYAPKGR